MKGHAFILGGAGQIGSALSMRLLTDGWSVTIGTRRRELPEALASRGARLVSVDRAETESLAHALGSGADALIDTVAYDETHADQLLGLESSIGHVVVVSSSSVYRDEAGRTLDEARSNGFPNFPAPLREDGATVEPGPATYSTRKAALERSLLDRARRPLTILRPGAIHGPHSLHPREWWFVKRMRDGRAIIPLAYRGESRFHTSAAVNIAALVRTVLDAPATRILNAADPESHTVAEMGAAIARHVGWSGRFRLLEDDTYPPTVGATPWSVPAPFRLDMGAADALGYRPAAGYAEASASSCAELMLADPADWRRLFPGLAAYPRDHFDYTAEDAILKP